MRNTEEDQIAYFYFVFWLALCPFLSSKLLPYLGLSLNRRTGTLVFIFSVADKQRLVFVGFSGYVARGAYSTTADSTI